MELDVMQRLLLLHILPKEGDITMVRILRKLREDLSFTEEEHQKLNLRTEGPALVWDDKTYTKNVEIGLKAREMIVASLNRLNEQKKLTEEFLSLWEVFIEAGSVS